MKSFCLFAVAVLPSASASATSLAVNTNCQRECRFFPQQQTLPSGPGVLFRSASQDTRGFTASLPKAILRNSVNTSFAVSPSTSAPGVTPSFATNTQNQVDFLLQHSTLASLASPSDGSSLLGLFSANTINSESNGNSGPAHGATTTAEPSSLLLLSLGLLFVPFLRKHHHSKRARRLRPA